MNVIIKESHFGKYCYRRNKTNVGIVYKTNNNSDFGDYDYKWTLNNSCIPTLSKDRCKNLPIAFTSSTNSGNLFGTCQNYLNQSNGKCENDPNFIDEYYLQDKRWQSMCKRQ